MPKSKDKRSSAKSSIARTKVALKKKTDSQLKLRWLIGTNTWYKYFNFWSRTCISSWMASCRLMDKQDWGSKYSHGGRRWSKYGPYAERLIRVLIWLHAKQNPRQGSVNPLKVKFPDEAHVVSKALYRLRALSHIGEPVVTYESAKLDLSYSHYLDSFSRGNIAISPSYLWFKRKFQHSVGSCKICICMAQEAVKGISFRMRGCGFNFMFFLELFQSPMWILLHKMYWPKLISQ